MILSWQGTDPFKFFHITATQLTFSKYLAQKMFM